MGSQCLPTTLQEWALGLHWKPNKLIGFMLYGYCDESGEHASRKEGGSLIKMSLGACLAPLEMWRDFERQWADALAAENVDCFHAKDFWPRKASLNSKSVYYKWDDDRKDKFIYSLLDTMKNHVPYLCGSNYFIPPESITGGIKQFYIPPWLATIVMTCQAAIERFGNSERVTLVFASHPEITQEYLGKCADAIKGYFPQLEAILTCSPNRQSPLQAADLFSYEVSHCSDWNNQEARRPALNRLIKDHPDRIQFIGIPYGKPIKIAETNSDPV